MRKIRELNIKNFQSHKDTTINFQNYAIIHGATNSGKSAIIRAIKWCLYNEAPPEGAELTRFGEKETVVSITFDDGRKIVRKRSGKTNEYLTCDENGHENSYTGFGRGPLKEIVDFHGMYMANLFGEAQSVNIVDQQEPPFFLSEGPTARGHLISRLADTLVYEAALIMLKKDAGEIKRNIEEKRNKIESLNTEINELSYVDEFKEFVAKAKEEKNQILANNKACTEIPASKSNIDVSLCNYKSSVKAASILEDITSSQAETEKITLELSKSKDITAKHDLIKQQLDSWTNKKKIADVLPDIEAAMSDLSFVESDVSRLKQMNNITANFKDSVNKYRSFSSSASIEPKILGVEEPIKEIEGNLSVAENILSESQKIKQCVNDFIKSFNDYENENRSINELSEKYKNILLEKGICPTCFGKISKEQLAGVEI